MPYVEPVQVWLDVDTFTEHVTKPILAIALTDVKLLQIRTIGQWTQCDPNIRQVKGGASLQVQGF